MVGCSYIYGLGAAGQAGVARAIEILQKELAVAMALCGVKRIGARSISACWPAGRND